MAAQPITFFEITTAAAFLAFARMPADIVLLETGLGGRLDATNVIDRPAATRDDAGSRSTTSSSWATRWPAIAGEKAGIFKPARAGGGRRRSSAEAAAVLAAKARRGSGRAAAIRYGARVARRHRMPEGLRYAGRAGPS